MAKVMCSNAVNCVMASLGMAGNASEHQEIVESLQKYVSDMKDMIIKDQGELPDDQWKLMTRLEKAVRESEDLLDEVTHPEVRFPLPCNKIRKIKRLIDDLNSLKGIGENIIKQLGISDVDSHSGFKRIEETYPYVDERDVIGIQNEKESLVDILLSAADYDIISYVCVLGRGGIGKTTFAQLVYNDPRIQAAFTLRLWVCVSDDFSIREILTQILHFSGRENSDSELPFDELQKQFRDKIQGNKYFLVLDDVWCEDREQWIKLKELVNVGARGSIIMVTSRSNKVAKAMGRSVSLQLPSLSEEDSWHLFKRLAFSPYQEPDAELFEIGKQIVTKCAGLPLAIREVASLLFGQEKSKWLLFANTELADIGQYDGSRILPTLRLSYDALPPEVRKCFEFCSIFPKDYDIEKEVLISMWMAQGYLVPTRDGQSMEDIGKEYCSILLSRSFFQDPINDECGEVISFKMHDLIHDFARKVAGEDFLMLTDTPQLEKEFRHLSISESASSIDLFGKQYVASKTLRTIFNLREYVPCSSKHVTAILSQCGQLTILDLQGVAIETLPNTFDKVPNLRYLDLSGNEILKRLPKSIAKLLFLQTLRLRGCKSLKQFPATLGRTRSLMTLNIYECDKLNDIPRWINWSCLHMHTMSVLGGDNHGNGGEAQDIKYLVKLKGDIIMKVEQDPPSNLERRYILQGRHLEPLERRYILRETHLEALETICTDVFSDQGDVHGTQLKIKGNIDTKFTSITLSHSGGLEHLATLSQLRHLKYLRLFKLFSVESIQGDAPSMLTSGAIKSKIFFPSLEKLVLEWMPNLKGWWRNLTWKETKAGDGYFVDGNGSEMGEVILPVFSCLHDLTIGNCPSLTYFPPCPHVKQMVLKGVNEVFCMKGRMPPNPVAAESSNSRYPNPCLEKLIVYYNAGVFYSLFRKTDVQSAVNIDMKYFFREKNLHVAREGFQRCGSSVRNLSIEGFYELKSLSGGGIEHLTNLQSLSIKECFVLDLEEFEVDGEEEEEGMPWKSLRSLSSLTLDDIPKMVNLPKAFQYLTALESLHIKSCSNLEALGDCVQFLTSLKSLHIEDCINLKTLPDCFNSPMFQHIIPDIKNCPKLDMLHSNQEISVSE